MEPNNHKPSPDLVEQYRRQMMEIYRKQPAEKATEPKENWLDERFPEPRWDRDRIAISAATSPSPSPTPAPAETEQPPIAETPYVGYLRVFVFTGEQAIPLTGVAVTVSRDGTLYGNTITDRDGYTQVIPLPTVNPERTLTPGNDAPYIAYQIRVSAPGYTPAHYENIPIYGNNYVTLPVALLPLLPGADPEAYQDIVSGGPNNL